MQRKYQLLRKKDGRARSATYVPQKDIKNVNQPVFLLDVYASG
jgi:hypothetical protein